MQRSSWQDALDPVIDAAIATQRIVGAVVLVCHRGEPVFRRAAGLDRETQQALHEGAIFRLASLSEPVVAAAVLALVDGGRLSLDDAVTRYLPEFRPRLPDGEVPEVRLRHLLNHTCGLHHGFIEPPGDAQGPPLQENLRRLASVPLASRPGERWRHSPGLDVLGGVVEAATGHPLPEVVRQLIGEPLGWRDTGFTRRDAMVGTADEMLAFFEALRSDDGLLLSPAWSRAMRQDQTGGLPIEPQGLGWGFGYGGAVLLDPAVAQEPQAPGAWQSGGMQGHCWLVDAAEALTMVTLAHAATADMTRRFADELRAAVYRPARS